MKLFSLILISALCALASAKAGGFKAVKVGPVTEVGVMSGFIGKGESGEKLDKFEKMDTEKRRVGGFHAGGFQAGAVSAGGFHAGHVSAGHVSAGHVSAGGFRPGRPGRPGLFGKRHIEIKIDEEDKIDTDKRVIGGFKAGGVKVGKVSVFGAKSGFVEKRDLSKVEKTDMDNEIEVEVEDKEEVKENMDKRVIGGFKVGGVKVGGTSFVGARGGLFAKRNAEEIEEMKMKKRHFRAGGFRAGGFRAGGAAVGGFRAGGVAVGGVRAGGFRAGGVAVGGVRAGGFRAGGVRAGGFRAGGARGGFFGKRDTQKKFDEEETKSKTMKRMTHDQHDHDEHHHHQEETKSKTMKRMTHDQHDHDEHHHHHE